MRRDLLTLAPLAALLLVLLATLLTQLMPPSTTPSATAANPLLAAWTGPYGGVPAFDRMHLDDLEPALEAAMTEHLAEVDAIAAAKGTPTFENTIVALERAGTTMERVSTYYGIWSSNRSTPAFRAIQQRMAPRLAAYRAQLTQHQALFERVAAVHAQRHELDLRPDQQRLVERVYDRFARQGATLDAASQARYAAINQRLATLYAAFADRILADEEEALFLTAEQLGGVPTSVVHGLAQAAAERGRPEAYAVLNTRSSVAPVLTYARDRTVRERVWRAYTQRGIGGDVDNYDRIAEIVQLRHERAQLLGYPHYAAWQVEPWMAHTADQVEALLQAVWAPAVARVDDEVAAMQALAEAQGADFTIAPWDYRYYAEQVRQDRYAFDSEAVKQYLQLDRLCDALFFVAESLFGLAFTPVPAGTVPVFHDDVTVYEVTRPATGEHVGLWYLDPFARPGKRSGAWATTYRRHTRFDGVQTVLASNNANFIAGPPGTPVLLSFDDAETLFHEFGHALHYLTSQAAYPSLDTVVRDYVEVHSQLLERWLLTQPVIERFLVHHETGAPMPDALLGKIRTSATFNQGFATTEYLASALIDLAYHTADPQDLDPAAFEQATLAELGLPDEVAMRHRPPHFSHVFSGEGYAAGYYSYLWSDVLTADAVEAFAEAPGGFYDADLAARLERHLFAPRNAVDPAEAYRAFRGRDAHLDALLRDRGFIAQP
ncbi:MAG: M3 family metallopeptidase [Bacteroidota bacterium]